MHVRARYMFSEGNFTEDKLLKRTLDAAQRVGLMAATILVMRNTFIQLLSHGGTT